MAGDIAHRVLLFRARTRLCAIAIDRVRETMRPLPTEAVCDAPEFLVGVSLIRGVPTPVVDAGALVGAGGERAFSRYVTLPAGEGVVALAVEAVLGIREIAPPSFRRLPSLLRGASAEVLDTLATLDSELLTVLKLARSLSDRLLQSLEARGNPA